MSDSILDLTALADEIEDFIQQTIPKCVPVKKYGGTLFTLYPEEKEGQFCGVFVQKKDVQVSFSQGAQLKDPKGLLEGSGKLRRHINYSSIDKAGFAELKKLLRQSVKR